jgi:hypothetical protein
MQRICPGLEPPDSRVILEEFNLHYHPGHVRKMLKRLGYSLQRPTTQLVQADPAEKSRWVRYTYPRLKKSPDDGCFRG